VGEYVGDDASIIRGTWVDGELQGHVEEFAAAGLRVYAGPYVDSRRHGKGLLSFQDGCSIEGPFVEGYMLTHKPKHLSVCLLFHTHFPTYHPDLRPISTPPPPRHRTLNGSARFTYPDGISGFTGLWKDGDMEDARYWGPEPLEPPLPPDAKSKKARGWTSVAFSSDETTETNMGHHLLLRDPYEARVSAHPPTLRCTLVPYPTSSSLHLPTCIFTLLQVWQHRHACRHAPFFIHFRIFDF